MPFEKDFQPVLRFAVVSDIHYKDEDSVERSRMKSAVETAYLLSSGEDYPKLDALCVVGDFANSGTDTQMRAFKQTLDDTVKIETEVIVSLASHEFSSDGEENALRRFDDIFGMPADVHKVINGYHFISLSCTKGCHFDDAKKEWASAELKKAAKDDPKKPIFFFQHPHISGTVYGSANWGEDELTPILMNYPQIIDFSGHSHAPINDPRSIHQQHFTSLGTGTLSYFELDEFDKVYGTIPPENKKAAQMLIIEADAQNRVRVYPYDLISGNFFPYTWKIDTAWDCESFIYTSERYKNPPLPRFPEGAVAKIGDITSNGFTVTFDQAEISEDYVDDYVVSIKNGRGITVRRAAVWSEYYFYDMPETLSVKFDGLDAGEEYFAEIYAKGFWNNRCEIPLKSGTVKL